MILNIKKIILIAFVLIFCLNVTAFAQSSISFSLPGGFYSYSEAPKKVAEILKTTENELNSYCLDNSILYLAVDASNNRQIKVTVNDNSFSNSVINISNLTDDKIKSLAKEITGLKDVKGEVVKLDGQKFLKVQLESEDSGGKYILTQYITTASKQNITISFTNGYDTDTDYVEEIFGSVKSPLFSDSTDDSDKTSVMLIVIPIAAIAFLLICIGLGVSVILDIRKNKEDDEEDSEEDIQEIDTDKDSLEEKSQ